MAGPLALVWDLIATDNASAVFKRVGAEAGATGAATETLGSRFSKMGGAIAIAAVGVAVVSTKMAADFQEATTLLVTGAGESEKSIGMVRDGLLKMAPAVGIGPTALAKAMFMVESAGYHGAAGLTVMKAAAEGAKIGGADATVVANGLTTALTDYNLPASKAAEVTSKLVATVAAGKTNMGDLTASLSGVLPFAASLGVKFNDVAGAMATMTGEGVDAAHASTMLRFTMMSMANETPKGKDALKSIGMTAQQLKNDLSSKGVGGALSVVTEQIAKHFPAGSVKATEALAAIAGGTRGMGAALALTGTHAATLIANTKSIGAAATEAGGHVKGWKLTSEDLNVQISKLTAFLQQLAVKIGTAVIPVIEKAVTWMTQHKVIVEVMAGVIGGIMVVALAAWVVGLGAATVALFSVGGALAFVTWPIVAVIAGIALLVAGVIYAYNHFTTFRNIVNAVWEWLKGAVVATVSFVKDHFGEIVPFFQSIPGKVFAAISTVIDFIKKVFSYTPLGIIINNFGAIVSFIGGIPGKILGALGNLGGLLVSAGGDLLRGLANGISGAIGGVIDAAKNAASAAVNAVKGALGIHSPSTVFAELGAHTAQGFINGITGGTSGVGSAMRSMVALPTIGSLDFASSAVRSNAVKGVGAAGGGGGDIHLNATFTVDNQVLGHSLVKFSIAEARRNGTSGLKL